MIWLYILLGVIVLIPVPAFFIKGGEQCEKDIPEFQSGQR